jgi:hypothetical protein
MFAGREILMYIVIPVVVAWLFIRWYVIYAENHCNICSHHWQEHFQLGFDGCPTFITWNQRCRCLVVHRAPVLTLRRTIGRGVLLLRHRPALTEKDVQEG